MKYEEKRKLGKSAAIIFWLIVLIIAGTFFGIAGVGTAIALLIISIWIGREVDKILKAVRLFKGLGGKNIVDNLPNPEDLQQLIDTFTESMSKEKKKPGKKSENGDRGMYG